MCPINISSDHPSFVCIQFELSMHHKWSSKSPNSFKWSQKQSKSISEKCKNMISQNDRNRELVKILKYGGSDRNWISQKSKVLADFEILKFPIKKKFFSMEESCQKIFSLKLSKVSSEQLTLTIGSLWMVLARVGAIWKMYSFYVSP